MVFLYVATTYDCIFQPKTCTHPVNLEEPDTSCSDRTLNLLPVERTALMKLDNHSFLPRYFFKEFLVICNKFLQIPKSPSLSPHMQKNVGVFKIQIFLLTEEPWPNLL